MSARSPLLRFALLLLACAAPLYAQSFPQPTVIPTGNWPIDVVSADFNQDGKADLVYHDPPSATQQPYLHMLLGDGQGHFTSSLQLVWPGTLPVVADFTGSGQQEIANAYSAGPTKAGFTPICTTPLIGVQLYVQFQYSGKVSYQDAFCSVGSKPPVLTSLIAARLRDGQPPLLLFADVANSLLYSINWQQPVNGSLYTFTAMPLPDGGGPITAVDLNNDGHLDLIVNSQSSLSASIFLGDGTGKLIASGHSIGVGEIHSLLVKDVNLDGNSDLIAEGPNGRLDIFYGNGDGTFQTNSSGGTGTLDGRTGNGGHLITLADLNHDAQLDALTATPAGVSSLLGQGTAYLGLKAIANAGPGMHTFATADFNGDGSLDLATDSPEGIAILFGNPDGTFQTSQAFAAGQPALSGALGTFTASTHPDVILATGSAQAQALLGDGTGRFIATGGASTPTPTPAQNGLPGFWSSVATGDFNGDGNQDVLLTADGPASELPKDRMTIGTTMLLGSGTGTFQPFSLLSQSVPSACGQGIPSQLFGTSAVSDFDANGVTDFINRDADEERVFTGYTGQTPHPSEFIVDSACSPRAHDLVLAADFNNDSQTDVIRQSDGHLEQQFGHAPGLNDVIGDLSVDGSLTTPGQLTAPALSPVFGGTVALANGGLGFPAFIGSMATRDFDRDGNQDLAVVYANLSADRSAPAASAPNFLYVWFGSGGGKFLTSRSHPVNPVRIQLSRNYYQVAVADLNHDGIPDLILSDGYIVSVQNGLGDGTFGLETHLLAGQGINSLMLADVNGDGRPDLITANGGAVLSNPVANLEVLATNPDVNTGGITVLLNQPPKATPPTRPTPTGTLVATPNPVAFEATFTLTATVGIVTSTSSPTGTVDLSINNMALGSAPVVNGTATLTVPAKSGIASAPLLPGSYAATANYSGDLNFAPLSGLTTSLNVSRAPTSVILTPTTPLQTLYGGPVDGTFAISVVDNAYPTTGTGTVYDNGLAVPTCTRLPVTNLGTRIFCPYGNPDLLHSGTHSLQVGYDGDPINAPSISPAVTYIVSPNPTTTTNLTSSARIAILGQPITFSATVTGILAVPVGDVTFYASQLTHGLSVPIGKGSLNSAGLATLTIPSANLGLGTFLITASYPGNQDFKPSGAGPITQIVILQQPQLASTVSLTSSVNPSVPTQPVTFTATVSVAALHPPVAPGTIIFLDGQTVLATQPLNSTGSASFTTGSLTSGTHPIMASYSGAGGVPAAPQPSPPRPPGNPRATGDTVTILPSISPVLTQVVTTALRPEPIGFTISVTPTPVTLGVGRSAVLLVQVTPVSGFAQPVALSCGDLPYEVTCSFAQPAIPAGGGATTLTLTTQAPHDCGNPGAPYFLGESITPYAGPARGVIIFAAMFVPGVALLGCIRRRRLRALTRDLIILALAAAGMASISGCGRCTDLGTGAATFKINVVGSAAGGPVSQTQTQTFPLTTHY